MMTILRVVVSRQRTDPQAVTVAVSRMPRGVIRPGFGPRAVASQGCWLEPSPGAWVPHPLNRENVNVKCTWPRCLENLHQLCRVFCFTKEENLPPREVTGLLQQLCQNSSSGFLGRTDLFTSNRLRITKVPLGQGPCDHLLNPLTH